MGILEIGVEDSGVEPWGRLVEGGREGCDRGSIVARWRGERRGRGGDASERRERETGEVDWDAGKTDHESSIEHVSFFLSFPFLLANPRSSLFAAKFPPRQKKAKVTGIPQLKRKI